jgi:predicted NUDIX family NTP pyrophosphohydrolase
MVAIGDPRRGGFALWYACHIEGLTMARVQSAGVLLYRRVGGALEVLLVHPGGPFWARKDEGAWSIPKGEFDAAEPASDAARREFAEETGVTLNGEFVALAPVRQPSGKIVHPFAVAGDLDVASIASNRFELEWPPRSGRMQSFPEIDRAAWFTLDEARRKILKGQLPILDDFAARLETASEQKNRRICSDPDLEDR